MKPVVAVILIIGGVIIVALPPLSDAWRTLMSTRVLEHGAHSAFLQGSMENEYCFGCWVLGAAMIGVAIIASLTRPSIEAGMRQRTPGDSA
jgi:hypothetical protein